MSLTDTAIRTAKPKEKEYKITDEKGMYLLVTKSGSKYFRFDYRFAGRRKTLALGVYPETTLKEARERRDEARKQLQNGIDPLKARKDMRLQLIEEQTNTFHAVALEWYGKYKDSWVASHAKDKWNLLEKNVFPYIAGVPIKHIKPQELLQGQGFPKMTSRWFAVVQPLSK